VALTVEYRYDDDDNHDGIQERQDPGSLTLCFCNNTESSPENIRGSFQLMDLEGAFTGLKPAEEDMEQAGRWDIMKFEWAPGFSSQVTLGIATGHRVEIYKALDDNGNHFIAFIWNQGWDDDDCEVHYATCIAKKVVGGTFVGLSDSERERLGMYQTWDEIEDNGASCL
jgi:hypothetical protein